jgi:hypothetical protein
MLDDWHESQYEQRLNGYRQRSDKADVALLARQRVSDLDDGGNRAGHSSSRIPALAITAAHLRISDR